jgi:signal transduction histidine kinase
MQDRKQDFACELSESALMVSGDDHRLTQVFVNLLNNASKFSDANGSISLVAAAEGNEAVVRVVDKGIGIAPDQLVSIFELFSQVNSSRPESQLGLGIGLALTRDLVTLHGGTIQARSEGPGTGSEFIVRLPLISGIQEIT